MMGMLLLLGQAAAAPPPVAPAGANQLLQLVLGLFAVVNLVPIVCLLTAGFFHESEKSFVARLPKIAGKFLLYEMLLAGACIMLLPFYWMIVTSFKDGRTAATFPPIWTPSRIESKVAPPGQTTAVPVVELETARKEGDKVKVVPVDKYEFKRTVVNGIPLTREIPDPASVFLVDPTTIQHNTILNLDLKNFRRAWYRPEDSSRGQVNFLTYFFVSTTSSLVATLGTLLSGALAAFAFARLTFYGKEFLFYMVLATMMVPGQVLLIPNFLILSKLGLARHVSRRSRCPWLASVFTIFLMRQFFMTIPEDLWDAARVDGASRFRLPVAGCRAAEQAGIHHGGHLRLPQQLELAAVAADRHEHPRQAHADGGPPEPERGSRQRVPHPHGRELLRDLPRRDRVLLHAALLHRGHRAHRPEVTRIDSSAVTVRARGSPSGACGSAAR
jgi:multiple sugar transport system permease protein